MGMRLLEIARTRSHGHEVSVIRKTEGVTRFEAAQRAESPSFRSGVSDFEWKCRQFTAPVLVASSLPSVAPSACVPAFSFRLSALVTGWRNALETQSTQAQA